MLDLQKEGALQLINRKAGEKAESNQWEETAAAIFQQRSRLSQRCGEEGRGVDCNSSRLSFDKSSSAFGLLRAGCPSGR